jgi:transposase
MAIEIYVREQIIAEKKLGKTLITICEENGLSYKTVKRIWASYKKDGIEGIKPKYFNCGPKLPRYYKIYRISIFLKKKYSAYCEWGAPYICCLLSKRFPNEKMPNVRTMQKWFVQNGLNKPKTSQPKPTKEDEQVQNPHDCWQIDAKENITLEEEGKACYLTTTDVKSGIALAAPFFP